MLFSSCNPRSWRAGGRQNPSESTTEISRRSNRIARPAIFRSHIPSWHIWDLEQEIQLRNRLAEGTIILQGPVRTDDDEDGRQLKTFNDLQNPSELQSFVLRHFCLRLEKSLPASDSAGTLRAPCAESAPSVFGLCRSWSCVWVASGPMSADAWKSKAQLETSHSLHDFMTSCQCVAFR